MKTTLLLFSLALVAALGGATTAVLAQSSSADQVPATTVTGCLVKGDQSGQFAVQVSKTNKVEVTAGEDLNTHLNKQVKVTGSMEAVQGRSVFKAAKVEVVSNVCTEGT
jgi:hypothetical protein